VTRRRDAALALAVSVPLALRRWALGGGLEPTAVLAGVAGALTLEWVLSLDASRVRRVWEHRAVQAAAVAATAVGVALGVVAVGPWALTAVLAGLCAYLLVLLAVELRDRRRPET
jgi:hypothetical protein